MERLLTSRLFPVLATSIGAAAGAGAAIGYDGDVIGAAALGIALAAAIMTLRNWLVSEEERPLLAEELLGMHEQADALRGETREMRRMLSELTSIVEEILADNESETAIATDRATASLMAARLDQTERRLLAAETSLNKLGGGGPQEPRALSEEALAALAEDSDLATLAQQATTARRLVTEVSDRLDEHDQRAGKLAQALAIAVREARNNAERLQQLERQAREPNGGGSGGASSDGSGGGDSSAEPQASKVGEAARSEVKAMAAVSEPTPKDAKQAAARGAEAVSIGAARPGFPIDGDRTPRAQAEAVGMWRGAARVSGEAPDASGVVREPLLPLGGLPAQFSDWDAAPDNDAVKPTIKDTAGEAADTSASKEVAQAPAQPARPVAPKKPETPEAATSARLSHDDAKTPNASIPEEKTAQAAKTEVDTGKEALAQKPAVGMDANKAAMSPTRMALRDVRDADLAKAESGSKAVPASDRGVASDGAARPTQSVGARKVVVEKESRSKIRIVDDADLNTGSRPAAKIVKAPAKQAQVEAKAKPVVRLVETPAANSMKAAKPSVVNGPAQALAAIQVEQADAALQPGEDPRHQLALQPILRLSDAAPMYYEAVAPEDLVLDDPSAASEDIANVLVVRSMTVVDQFRRNGSDASVFCNVSMTMLRRKEFLTRFMECLDSRSDLSDQLVLEFHQSEVGDIATGDAEVLSGIQGAGFSFSMDHVVDWEAGIERLADIGFRFIKLNASDFMAQIRTEAKAESLLTELRNLDLELIVENVDTSLQREAVMAAGAPYAQGQAIDEPKLVRLD
ncbi:MAG: EAL domain-containing protein [Rhodobacteraceae bacterium]|nr:EAL domain-containing protein [Paracoccaceae bacterium]